MAESPSELQTEIEQLERKHAENPDGRYFVPLANDYRKLGNVEQAESLLRAGLEKHPDYLSARIVLGRCLADRSANAEATEEFDHVLSMDPQNLIALRSLAELALADGRRDDAERWYRELLAVDPMNDDARQALETITAASAGAAPDGAEDGSWWDPEDEAGGGMAEEGGPGAGEPEPEAAPRADLEQEPGLALGSDLDLDPGPEPEPDLAPEPATPPTGETRSDGGDLDDELADWDLPEEVDSVEVVTETIAELYARQGLHDRAAGVYRELIRQRGGDPELEARLAEVERAAAAEAGSADAPAAPAEEPRTGEPLELLELHEPVEQVEPPEQPVDAIEPIEGLEGVEGFEGLEGLEGLQDSGALEQPGALEDLGALEEPEFEGPEELAGYEDSLGEAADEAPDVDLEELLGAAPDTGGAPSLDEPTGEIPAEAPEGAFEAPGEPLRGQPPAADLEEPWVTAAGDVPAPDHPGGEPERPAEVEAEDVTFGPAGRERERDDAFAGSFAFGFDDAAGSGAPPAEPVFGELQADEPGPAGWDAGAEAGVDGSAGEPERPAPDPELAAAEPALETDLNAELEAPAAAPSAGGESAPPWGDSAAEDTAGGSISDYLASLAAWRPGAGGHAAAEPAGAWQPAVETVPEHGPEAAAEEPVIELGDYFSEAPPPESAADPGPAPAAEEDDDLESFQAWLRSLKR